MGLEGFTGNESILYHLTSPCRIKELGDFEPIKREEWVPDAHAHRHFKTIGIEPEGDEISGRKLLMWNNDVEISLVRPSETMDYFFRNGEGDEVYFVHEGSGTLAHDLRRPALQGGRLRRHPARDDLPLRAVRPAALPALRDAGADRDPEALPQPVRAADGARALLPPRHPPADRAPDGPRAGRVPAQDPRPRRLPGLRDRLPPVRRRGLGRLPLPVDVQHQRLRADHGADPHAAAVAPDLPGPELRHLLVLPAQARLRPAWRSRSRTTTRISRARR